MAVIHLLCLLLVACACGEHANPLSVYYGFTDADLADLPPLPLSVGARIPPLREATNELLDAQKDAAVAGFQVAKELGKVLQEATDSGDTETLNALTPAALRFLQFSLPSPVTIWTWNCWEACRADEVDCPAELAGPNMFKTRVNSCRTCFSDCLICHTYEHAKMLGRRADMLDDGAPGGPLDEIIDVQLTKSAEVLQLSCDRYPIMPRKFTLPKILEAIEKLQPLMEAS